MSYLYSLFKRIPLPPLALMATLLLSFLVATPLWAATETLTFGVFAFRPKPVMQARYQPLADYLSAQLKDVHIELRILEQSEMEVALANNQLDLLMTNPSHYLTVRSMNSLTGALATLVTLEAGHAVSQLGGCIITAANRQDIGGLEDLAGLRIAVPGTKYLGGYQTQAYELAQAGVHLPQDVTLMVVDKHDNVVTAVLEGRADVGFVRTGILESLVEEGKLDLARLKLINPQQFDGFPFLTSTRLYPEWPFVALPHVDHKTMRRLAAALYSLEPDHPAAQAAKIAGFAPPKDYLPVENMARALRMAPFNQVPEFTWQDVWAKHRYLWLALLLALAAIAVLLARLAQRNRMLHLKEERHRLAQEATDVGIWDWDILRDRVIWDAACWQMLGYPPLADPSDRRVLSYGEWKALIHPDDLAPAEGEVQTRLASGEKFVIEFRMRTAHGEWLWIQGRGQIVRHQADGSPARMMGTHANIHASKLEQQRVAEMFARLQKIAAHVPGVVYQFQLWPDGRSSLPYASEGLRDIYGVEPEAVRWDATSAFSALHPDDFAHVQDSISHSAEHLSIWHSQHRVLLPGDKLIWVEGEATPERQEDGSTLWHGYIRDITERKQLELALREERLRLANILWGTGVGTWEWNVQTGETHFNERWAELIGYRLAELAPISIETWLKYAHPDDLKASQAALNRHFSGESDTYECESRMRHKDGHWIWVLDRGKVNARTAAGEPLWMSGTHFDISERKAKEQALATLTEQLQRSNTELEQFAYVASHDLRQPLRMVSSYVSMLEKILADKLDEETRQMMYFAIDGAKRMDQMLVSLLEYSRVGRKGEPMVALSSRGAVEEALSFLAPAMRESGAQVQLTGEWPELQASRDEFTRLFQNLISNAIKYRAADRVPAIVISAERDRRAEDEISAEANVAHWRFCVTDNGIGIDPAQFSRLFRVFQRLHTRDKYEGSGIGLAVARKIVERHNGKIGVESPVEQGQGCRFCFSLPVRQQQDELLTALIN